MSLSSVVVTSREHKFEKRENSQMDEKKKVSISSHLHVVITPFSLIIVVNCYDRCLLISGITRLEQRLFLSGNQALEVAKE